MPLYRQRLPAKRSEAVLFSMPTITMTTINDETRKTAIKKNQKRTILLEIFTIFLQTKGNEIRSKNSKKNNKTYIIMKLEQKIEKLLNDAKNNGYITECDKSRILNMSKKNGASRDKLENLLNGIKVKSSSKAKFNRDLQLVSFESAWAWIDKQQQPVSINTQGGVSPFPFHVKLFGSDILINGNEQGGNASEYVLTKTKWDRFCSYVQEHPNMCRAELGDNYRDYDCENRNYWPVVIAISKAVLNSK